MHECFSKIVVNSIYSSGKIKLFFLKLCEKKLKNVSVGKNTPGCYFLVGVRPFLQPNMNVSGVVIVTALDCPDSSCLVVVNQLSFELSLLSMNENSQPNVITL